MPPDHEHDTIAGALNTGQPGNEAGKPVTDEVTLGEHDERVQVDESEHDDVWANAEILEHTPDAPGPYA